MIESLHRSFACMGTVVTLQAVGFNETASRVQQRHDAVLRAAQWFYHIEKSCNRFDPDSEVRQLAQHAGSPRAVSELLLQAVQFALAVAEESDGAFDPTVGHRMQQRGFNRAYQSGEITASQIMTASDASYRDVEVNSDAQTITLHKPLLLDLGAVVKGLAIDLAARELAPLANFEINAGGDVYVGGTSARGDAWLVGIRHPRIVDALIATVRVSNCAVCTSGDYERINSDTGQHHIMHARTGSPARDVASVTVIAPSAMVADALATAAFALGPSDGMALIARHELHALFVMPDLTQSATPGFPVV